MGRAVAQTLANVTLSYFKIFILLPLTKMRFGAELIVCSSRHTVGAVRGRLIYPRELGAGGAQQQRWVLPAQP